MTYKQALCFIGNCLALSHNPSKKQEVINAIISNKIEWSKIVSVSTSHMVLPALYLNLKRAKLLNYLPQDLLDYCDEITELNRERNKAIIKQAITLVALLKPYNINPIFLKGTAHLLEGLYNDIGERMVGDIDFLVAENKIEKTANLLIKMGYKPMNKFISTKQLGSKHYPRLINPKEIAAVEIHWAVVLQSHKTNLNYRSITKNKQFINEVFVPSFRHQAIHNILNTQINDKGFLYGKVMPRQLYDGFLLLQKPQVLQSCLAYKYDYYRKKLYLKLIQNILGLKKFETKDSFVVQILMLRYKLRINYPKINYLINYSIFLLSRLFSYPKIIIQAIYKNDVRLRVINNLKDSSWYGKHIMSYKNPGF